VTEETGKGASRRRVLSGVLGVTAGGLAARDAAGRERPPERMPPQLGDRFQVVGSGELAGRVVRPDDIRLNAPPVEAFAYEPVEGTLRHGSRLYRLLVVRLDPAEIEPEVVGHADGVLVFSAVCTHKGCTVNGWDEARRVFRCPCHVSEFAPLEGGRRVDGPATRPLPMLPVGLDDEGYVAVGDDFNRKPGFQS